jgi:hypothetical protein
MLVRNESIEHEIEERISKMKKTLLEVKVKTNFVDDSIKAWKIILNDKLCNDSESESD